MKKCAYPKQTVYYTSFSEDFDGGDLKAHPIDGKYVYDRRNIFYRVVAAFLYRCVAFPIAFLYAKLVTKDKYIGKEKLRKFKKKGVFIYSNHTQLIADAFSPNVLTSPRRCCVVISSKNMSLPIIGRALPMLGGIPLPTDISAARGFSAVIKKLIKEGAAITIYPEAHVWPFFTGIRPFGSESFGYPIRFDAPVFSATRVYKKHRRGYRCEVYVDGPFFAPRDISPAQAREALAKEVSEAMIMRSAMSDIEVIAYRERELQPENPTGL